MFGAAAPSFTLESLLCGYTQRNRASKFCGQSWLGRRRWRYPCPGDVFFSTRVWRSDNVSYRIFGLGTIELCTFNNSLRGCIGQNPCLPKRFKTRRYSAVHNLNRTIERGCSLILHFSKKRARNERFRFPGVGVIDEEGAGNKPRILAGALKTIRGCRSNTSFSS